MKQNQELLHEFIEKQESWDLDFSANFEVSLKLVQELFEKSQDLSRKLQLFESNNSQLSQKIVELSAEIAQMRNYLEIEADFFIWKVLIIAFLSCLSCFIVNYCVSNLFEPGFSRKSWVSDQFFEDFAETPQKTAKSRRNSKKNLQKTKSVGNSLTNLQNRRFTEALRKENSKEILRKRSLSVEEKRYLWGISPKQFSKYFFSKFVSAL